MFERYTERARRVLFFARYEASQLGSISIETEHLLLGLIREGKGLTGRIFARSHVSFENVCKEIEGRVVVRETLRKSESSIRDDFVETVFCSVLIYLLPSAHRPGRDRFDNWQIDREQDRDNDAGHEDQDQRFEQRGQLLELDLRFRIIEGCDLI